MEYTVLYDDNLEDLEAQVEDYIEEGWEPQGGIAVFTQYVNLRFYQAMIRLASED